MRNSPTAFIIALFAAPLAYLAATLAFPLTELYDQPGPKASERASGWAIIFNPAHILFDALLLIAIVAYLFAIHRWPATKIASHLRTLIIALPILSALILIFFYPLTSTDVYDLTFRAHITNRGGNPLTDLPFDFRFYPDGSKDRLYAIVAWYNDPSPYGPAWELLAAPVQRLAATDLLANIFAFKLVALASYTACAALVVALARHLALDPLRAYYLFAAAPLVLFDALGNGHNDLTLVACILLAYLLILRGALWLALPTLALAILVKFIPLILIPLLLIYGICKLGWWRTIRQTLLGGTISLLLAIACYAPFWQGWQSIAPLHRTTLFTNSPAAAAVQFAKALKLDIDITRTVVLIIVAVLALILIAWQTSRIWHTTPAAVDARLITASGSLLLYFAAFCLVWWQPWYFIWAIPLLALRPQPPLLILTATYATIFLYYAINTLEKVKIGPGNHENDLALYTFPPLLITLAWQYWQSRRQPQKAPLTDQQKAPLTDQQKAPSGGFGEKLDLPQRHSQPPIPTFIATPNHTTHQ